ncbi:MAG: lipoate--protein ligase family protein [Gemmatimonadales bacterium]
MLPTEGRRAQPWSLFVEPDGQPGAVNMAIDAWLLEQAGRTGGAVLRLYRFVPPCLSFGRNEPARERYDREAISRLRLDVVRRPTGGRAVWHEHEVTYAVAAPVAAFGSLRQGYLAIHTRLAAALRSLGADATLASDRPTDRPPGRPGPCFALVVGGEVLVGGHKVIGSAQVRLGDAFLQHGSILLDGSQEIVRAVSREPSPVRVTTLSAALGRPVTFAQVAEAIVRAWGDGVTPTASHHPLPPPTTCCSDPAWTWRR